jgi:histone deacetylase complex subunit SAP18
VKQVVPTARVRDTRLSFALVYPNQEGRAVLRTVAQSLSTRPGRDDQKTLDELRFEIGDFVDVAVLQ